MNRSWRNKSYSSPGWRNNSSSSPGFVYFNTNQNPGDGCSSDFISFGDPPEHSSPKCKQKYSPSIYNGPNFQHSPRKFNLRNTYRYSGSNHGSRSFCSPNNSFSSSFNNSGRRNDKNRSRGSFNNTSANDGKQDMSAYLDHTCTKDPWADLEQELRKTQDEARLAKESKDTSVSSVINNQEKNLSSSEDSDSDDKSASSVAEEETT